MGYFVDTSVWSLAFRRDVIESSPHVKLLLQLLSERGVVFYTGLVLQELLQGFGGPRAFDELLERFSVLPCLEPSRQDYVGAAKLRNVCRRNGVQVGTIDALLAQLCLRHDLEMLSTDADFSNMTPHCGIRVWAP